MLRRRALLVLFAVLAAALLAAAVGVLGSGWVAESGVLWLSPMLLLLVPLSQGRYVGEEQLARMAAPARGPRRAPVRLATSVRPVAQVQMPRGGRLIAFSLAVRPPPALITQH